MMFLSLESTAGAAQSAVRNHPSVRPRGGPNAPPAAGRGSAVPVRPAAQRLAGKAERRIEEDRLTLRGSGASDFGGSRSRGK